MRTAPVTTTQLDCRALARAGGLQPGQLLPDATPAERSDVIAAVVAALSDATISRDDFGRQTDRWLHGLWAAVRTLPAGEETIESVLARPRHTPGGALGLRALLVVLVTAARRRADLQAEVAALDVVVPSIPPALLDLERSQ